MKKCGFCLGIALILASLGAAAKEAAPNEANKSDVEPGKRERRFAAREFVDESISWQPYLRWHRDATSLQGSNDRRDPLGRSLPYTQL